MYHPDTCHVQPGRDMKSSLDSPGEELDGHLVKEKEGGQTHYRSQKVFCPWTHWTKRAEKATVNGQQGDRMAYWRSNADDRRVPNMTPSQRFNYTDAWLRHEVTDSIFALINDERNGGFRATNQYQYHGTSPSPPRSGSSRGSGQLFEGSVNFEGINFGRLSQGSSGSGHGQHQGYTSSPKSLSQGSLPIMFTSSQSSSISNRSNPMTHFENQFMLHDQFRSSSQGSSRSSQEPPWKRSRYDARTP